MPGNHVTLRVERRNSVNTSLQDQAPGSPRYWVNRAVIDLCRAPDARAHIANKSAFFANYSLSAEERQALLAPEWRRLLELGVLPNLVYRYYMLHGLKPETFPITIKGAV
jgi:hypothetical protein